MEQAKGARLAAILWFVAAGLAALAFGIRGLGGGEVKWATGAMGLFCLAMGASAWRRSRPAPPAG